MIPTILCFIASKTLCLKNMEIEYKQKTFPELSMSVITWFNEGVDAVGKVVKQGGIHKPVAVIAGGGRVFTSLSSVQFVSPQCFNMPFQEHILSTHLFNLGSLILILQCPSV